MMETSHEITKLCESWWGKLADNTKEDQHRFAEQLLNLLGWRTVASIESKPVLAHVGSASYVLRGGAQIAVAAHFVMPGAIDPPSSLAKRGLDFCDTTRLLVNETRALNVDYAFITDLYRSYFYDARTDELLMSADSPAEFRRDMADPLRQADIESGSLEQLRRPPRTEVARHLHEWCHYWRESIVAHSGLADDAAFLAIDRLLVLRYLVGKAFSADSRGCGRLLCGLFHDIWFDWKADLFAAEPAIDAVLEKDTVAVPLLKESALHSRTKFSIATILESFNYGEAAEKARVRMVPDANEDRERYLARQTLANIDEAHIEIDLADEGYRAILHWFDKLVSMYERLDVEFEQQAAQGVACMPEIDLFEWSEIAARRPQALTDRLQHAVERGMTVYYSAPRQLRTARLMLYLHVISRYHQSKQRFLSFPKIDAVFQKRPRVLEVDRKWIFQGPPSEFDE
ncbi:MAG: hypothetical protein NTU83_01260 [Candidatus Hydrogenedentes bacterium]|nr:hypothetical protein [Candidatus Hydrogenedentota bacterium]